MPTAELVKTVGMKRGRVVEIQRENRIYSQIGQTIQEIYFSPDF